MAKDNTWLWVAAIGVGGYLWYQSQNPAAPAPIASNAIPAAPPVASLPVYLNPPASNLATGASGAAPPQVPVVQQPIPPVTQPLTVSPQPAAGNLPMVLPVSIPIQQPVMPFGVPAGTVNQTAAAGPIAVPTMVVVEPDGNQKIVAAPASLAQNSNNAEYMMFENGDYPGAHPSAVSGFYC